MTQYAVLFEVEILHDYHLNRSEVVYEALRYEQQFQVMSQYSTERFLSITPTAQTDRTLAGYQLLFKPTETGFLVATRLDSDAPTARPFLPLASNFQLTFGLRIDDPYFFNYTALSASSLGFYWFSNRSENAVEGKQFLSAAVSAFAPDQAYEADQVYSENSSDGINLYRALRDTGPAASPIAVDWERIPHDTFDAAISYKEGAIVLWENQLYQALQDVVSGSDLDDTAQWESLGTLANQYVTAADKVVIKPDRFNLDLRTVALSQATVRIFRSSETVPLWEQEYEAEVGTLETVQVLLSGFIPGLYRLEIVDASSVVVPDLGFEFYLDADAVRDRWFGVIDIGLGSGSMALLEATGNLRMPPPRYQLRFLNRATRWRYHFPAIQAVGPGADVDPDPADNRILITPLPYPLTRWGGGIRLQADAGDSETSTVLEEVLLPEPGISRIRRQQAQWYSEIYLFNLKL
jgi:hypothetical protein